MNDKNFELTALDLISRLASQIEAQDFEYLIDIDYSNEVLKLEIEDKIFIINKQTPVKEIWLASPLSGPYHFRNIGDEWIDKKGNEVKEILSRELTKLQTQKIDLK